MSEWISLSEAAKILGVSTSTIYRSVSDPSHPEHKTWGEGNWRRKPFSRRGDFQLRRDRVEQIANPDAPPPEPAE